MGATTIAFGSDLARIAYGVAVFAEMYNQPVLTNKLVGTMPTQSQANEKAEKGQSSKDMPIVQSRELAKNKGDTITMDTFNVLVGKPVMGDAKIAGKLMGMTSSTQKIRIDQTRGGVDTGGRMTNQRTVHNLRTMGKALVMGWGTRLLEQQRIVHLMGARGGANSHLWVVPLQTDPDFSGILVNDVKAPTYTRHLCVDGTDGELVQGEPAWYTTNVANTDKMTLNTINHIKTITEETHVPLQNIKLPNDIGSDMDPLFLLIVTPRQWQELRHTTGSADDWETFLANAEKRGSKNPLFTGDAGIWNGILVRKYNYPVRFNWDGTLQVATSADDHTETSVTIKSAVTGTNGKVGAIDRAVLLGAQALGEAWGAHDDTNTHARWFERKVAEDHDASFEGSISMVGGCSKITYKSTDGKDYDHGAYIIDSFVEGL